MLTYTVLGFKLRASCMLGTHSLYQVSHIPSPHLRTFKKPSFTALPRAGRHWIPRVELGICWEESPGDSETLPSLVVLGLKHPS